MGLTKGFWSGGVGSKLLLCTSPSPRCLPGRGVGKGLPRGEDVDALMHIFSVCWCECDAFGDKRFPLIKGEGLVFGDGLPACATCDITCDNVGEERGDRRASIC